MLDEKRTSAGDADVTSPIINEEECCEISIDPRSFDSGIESTSKTSVDVTYEADVKKANEVSQLIVQLPPELIKDLAELKIFTRLKPKVRPTTKRPPTSYTLRCLRESLLKD